MLRCFLLRASRSSAARVYCIVLYISASKIGRACSGRSGWRTVGRSVGLRLFFFSEFVFLQWRSMTSLYTITRRQMILWCSHLVRPRDAPTSIGMAMAAGAAPSDEYFPSDAGPCSRACGGFDRRPHVYMLVSTIWNVESRRTWWSCGITCWMNGCMDGLFGWLVGWLVDGLIVKSNIYSKKCDVCSFTVAALIPRMFVYSFDGLLTSYRQVVV